MEITSIRLSFKAAGHVLLCSCVVVRVSCCVRVLMCVLFVICVGKFYCHTLRLFHCSSVVFVAHLLLRSDVSSHNYEREILKFIFLQIRFGSFHTRSPNYHRSHRHRRHQHHHHRPRNHNHHHHRHYHHHHQTLRYFFFVIFLPTCRPRPWITSQNQLIIIIILNII